MTRYLRAWVVGGDGRYPWAVKYLRDWGLTVKTWGVPGEENQAPHLEEALSGANLVLLPMVPFREDVLTVEGESVEAGQLPRLLEPEATLIAGQFPEDLEAWLQNQGIRCVSLLELEGYLLENAAVTAEGGVYLAMKHMDRTLSGARALVIGWGRIGKFLAEKLRALGADVTVAVRRPQHKVTLRLLGYQTEETGSYAGGLGRYDLIINTVPGQVMTEEQLATTQKSCTMMELASLPGGFPKSRPREIIMGQALPGKTAPATAGKNLAAAVLECLVGEGRTLE